MQLIVLCATNAAAELDWTKLIGIPGAIASVLGLGAYFVGLVHPIALRDPTYWRDGNGTRVTVAITNRSPLWDRNVERIFMYKVPGFFKRAVNWKWRKHTQAAEFVPWGTLPTPNNPIKLSKREIRSIEFELRTPAGQPAQPQLDKAVRIESKSGHQRSRSKKIELTNI
jgi:hypothetical protein